MMLRRRMAMHWPLFMAAIFSSFSLMLVWSLYSSQSQLRLVTDARLAADSQRRAAAVADFISERRQAVEDLAGHPEIEAYLVNRALGMSPQYGLNATLAAVEQRFRQQIEQQTLRGQPVYTRIVFLAEDGHALASAGREAENLPVLGERTPRLHIDTVNWRMVATAPVVYKGSFSGTVATFTDLAILSRLLIGNGVAGSANGKYEEYLLTDAGVGISAPDRRSELAATVGRDFAALPENMLVPAATVAGGREFGDLLALRTTIADSGLSMLTLMSEADAHGPLASPAYTLFLGVFSLAMLFGAYAFERLRNRAMRLQDDYAASDHHRAELEQRNQALSAEIARREAVEAALCVKTAELDKSNADLRASRERLDFALQGANDGLWDWNLETDEVYYSPRWKSMLGYAENELQDTPETLAALLDPQQREKVLGLVAEYVGGRSAQLEIEFRMRHKWGHWVDILSRATLARDQDGRPMVPRRLVGTHVDISKRKASEEEIKYLAFYDPLTGLPNRRLLLDRLHQALAKSARSGHEGALLFIDLDNFKDLNDTLGHDKGDLLLQQVAQRLSACVREGDTVARLGGDEFVVMLEGLSESAPEAAAQAETVGKKILDTLNRTYLFADHEQHSTPSIGATLFGDDKSSVDELLKRADLAMYRAKSAGRNTFRFFDPEMQAAVTARAAMEVDLRKALANGEFRTFYQAQVAATGGVAGAEVLLRWQHPERGLVLPSEFIPLAEETGLILPVGDWVLESACRQLARWNKPGFADLTVAVNVSARQIRQPDFVGRVLDVLGRTGADPQRLKLELTESLLLEDVEDIIGKMAALKGPGVGFSLDDFGTGYSSLAYLKRLPLDELKIDRSFVNDVLTDPNDATIARSIVALGQSLGLAVIAEGVETEGQREFLASIGCIAYQGYLFSRPLPLERFETYLRKTAREPRATLGPVALALPSPSVPMP